MKAVSGVLPLGVAATLPHYACYQVRHANYPAITAQSGAHTHGLLYLQIPASAWLHIDAYEDDFYQRQTLTVLTSGAVQTAQAYVAPAHCKTLLSTRPWQLERFRREELHHFLSSLDHER